MTTIASCGGAWHDNIAAGIMYRLVFIPSTSSPNDVASSDISRLIIYYADWHDVDEDLMTVSSQGGEWFDKTYCGVIFRDLSDVPGNYFSGAASRSPKVIFIIRMRTMSTKMRRLSCVMVRVGSIAPR